MDELKGEVQALQQQLTASQQREARLSKQVEDYRAKADEVHMAAAPNTHAMHA